MRFFYPRGYRRIAVHPGGDLIRIPEVDLAIVDGETSVPEYFADTVLPFLDLPLGVGVSAQHDVATAGVDN